ncbi:recombinase family protein [Streptomyces actinomycinicus]|uniref:Recombinase family protein n=1 Tax=Streptomyces actinomycinicus TaxID=1695166 RepID=A0A937JQ56_9ACTN|nr:recombinase family protein [Streptomyces actinomycinicus]MBL1087564.1 recombinase family protein [Streptomyces actinomycinicus]
MKSTTARNGRIAAVYLRYYPQDQYRPNIDRRRIRRWANKLGLPELVFYVDNGCPSGTPRPELTRLVRHAQSGVYKVIFIPAMDALSTCAAEAQDLSARLSMRGCQVRTFAPSGQRAKTKTPKTKSRRR